jgi:hypothetical protein
MQNEDWGRRASVACAVMLACLATAFAAAAVSAAAQTVGSVPRNFRWFKATPAPPTWKVRALRSGDGFLFSPRNYTRQHDPDGVSLAVRNRHGTIVDYLDATPKQGAESSSSWPTYRLHIVAEESDLLREDARAYGLHFPGGKGSCVIDDYKSRVVIHHYREIACFVHGHTGASVVIAAALASNWAQAAPTLERAVEAYQVI